MTKATFEDSPVLLAERLLAPGLLENALLHVLETMFFCPAEELQEQWPALGALDFRAENCSSSRVAFTGPLAGRFTLLCRRELAASLAESFHGETPSAEEASAVLLELSNVVCGNLLSQLQANALFQLDSPTPLTPGDWTALESALRSTKKQPGHAHRAIRSAEGWILAWLEITP
jgi:CheY-specific phosphatase CheX